MKPPYGKRIEIVVNEAVTTERAVLNAVEDALFRGLHLSRKTWGIAYVVNEGFKPEPSRFGPGTSAPSGVHGDWQVFKRRAKKPAPIWRSGSYAIRGGQTEIYDDDDRPTGEAQGFLGDGWLVVEE